MAFIVLGILVIVAGLYAINIYNFFNITDTRLQASVEEIGNQLKRQANLIPNLVESTKGYLQHEKGIFDELAAARKTILSASSNPQAISQAADTMNQIIPRLLAVAESNPQIKADGVVMKMMDELRDTADKLMYSRRTLIDLSADYNMKLKTFPSNIIASMFNFKPRTGLQVADMTSVTSVSKAETQDVQVKL